MLCITTTHPSLCPVQMVNIFAFVLFKLTTSAEAWQVFATAPPICWRSYLIPLWTFICHMALFQHGRSPLLSRHCSCFGHMITDYTLGPYLSLRSSATLEINNLLVHFGLSLFVSFFLPFLTWSFLSSMSLFQKIQYYYYCYYYCCKKSFIWALSLAALV